MVTDGDRAEGQPMDSVKASDAKRLYELLQQRMEESIQAKKWLDS